MHDETFAVPTGRIVRGRLRPPSSKSLTQRALNLALLSGKATTILQPLMADDTRLYLSALENLGFESGFEAGRLRLEPKDRVRSAGLWCGHNGTMLRFLTAALAVMPGDWFLDGSDRLRQRPVGPLVAALRDLGARIEYVQEAGYAPLKIEGGHQAGGVVTLDARLSSQFASALLMALSRSAEPVTVRVESPVSVPYLDLTLEMLRRFGGDLEVLDVQVYLCRPAFLGCEEVEVESDFSAAAYPAAAAFLTGGEVTLMGLDRLSKQGDRRFLEILETMGAELTWGESEVRIAGGAIPRAIDVDLADLPDQVPTLAAIAPFAEGRTVIRNVGHLRIKESDRLAAMRIELNRLGAIVEDRPDGLEIEGTWSQRPAPTSRVQVATHGDHRIAMSLALVGLRRPGVVISHPEVVAKSYPAFWQDLESLLEE